MKNALFVLFCLGTLSASGFADPSATVTCAARVKGFTADENKSFNQDIGSQVSTTVSASDTYKQTLTAVEGSLLGQKRKAQLILDVTNSEQAALNEKASAQSWIGTFDALTNAGFPPGGDISIVCK